MVGLGVELTQIGIQLGAHAVRQLPAAGEHGGGEYRAPALGDEHQTGVQVVDGVSAAPHVLPTHP